MLSIALRSGRVCVLTLLQPQGLEEAPVFQKVLLNE